MNIFSIISLFGGLALFLYGMSMLGTGLEKISGGRLEKTLEKLTSNVFKSVAFGAAVTAAVQSSSATTVIVVGLVNSKILTLKQAIGVIMGANIGTTVTAHILRLTDITSDNFFLLMLKPTTLAPLVAIIGIILFMSAKKTKKKDFGQVLLGFGILFTGLFNMEAAVKPLAAMPGFINLFAAFSNPIVGVIVGALVTAVIQSSSASVGILQALSSTGQITFASAFPIIMGQNIGTCVTPLIASVGASKNAKRAAAVHLIFNILGTVVFMCITYGLFYTIGFDFWYDAIDKGGIANFHTLFNITITLLFMPFTVGLEKLACRLVKDKPTDIDNDDITLELDDRFMVAPGLALQHGREAVLKMGYLAKDNFLSCSRQLKSYNLKEIERLHEVENVIDRLEDKLSIYLLKVSERELNDNDSRTVSELLHIMSEFERMGDYSINLVECAESMYQHETEFSIQAQQELDAICDAVCEIIDMAINTFETSDAVFATNIEPLEEVIDLMEQTLKDRHIERLRQGECTVDAAFPFVETLANLERISDHCSNVAIYVISREMGKERIDRHEYLKAIRSDENEHFTEHYAMYESKYYKRIEQI